MRYPLIVLVVVAFVVACKDKQPSPAPTPPPTAAPAAVEDAAAMTSKPVEPARDMPVAAEITSLVKANNNFALELWARAGSGNLAMSPASITTALAMAWAGAKDATADQMRKVMHLEGRPDEIVSQWARISKALQDPNRPLKLRLANRLYGDKHYSFDTTYFTITRKAFNAPLEMVDFAGAADEQRHKINTWVANQTEQRIKDLLPAQSVTADTRLAIVNAIYFLADWAQPFDKAATGAREFHVSATQAKQVPTMHRTAGYRIAHGDSAALLELPYQGDSASMYVVLPDQLNGLAELERGLAAKLKRLQLKLADATVELALPKFVIDPASPIQLREHLEALGMPLAFDRDKADFTAIAKPADPRDRLYLSAVLHKALVKVDEKGTEAAAATAVMMPTGMGAPQKPVRFIADHPFLFLIVDKTTGLILFIGRVVDPS